MEVKEIRKKIASTNDINKLKELYKKLILEDNKKEQDKNKTNKSR